MKKIGIIGAGISGLSIAMLLRKEFEIEILEKNDFIGGIARPRDINGFPYHVIGGHCMNSKNPKVMDFVFSVLSKDQWHLVDRNANIFFHGHYIPYPIEFAIREIAAFNSDLAHNIVKDFFNSGEKDAENLEEWFIEKFGKTLAEEYFIPYNRKIWAREPSAMSSEWVKDKLPIPDKNSFFKSLISKIQDDMPHVQFYYPNSNTASTFLDALAQGTKITRDYSVKKIEKRKDKWIINEEKEYDLVINTCPLKELPSILNAPKEIVECGKLLKYNTVTNMLWEVEPAKHGWVYYPSPETFIYKQGYVGNFLIPKKPQYASTEAITFHTEAEMLEEGKKFPNLKRPLAYSASKEPAYVVYDQNYPLAVSKIMNYLNSLENFYTLGRFGEWVYYNMDKCIESAMQLADKLRKDKN